MNVLPDDFIATLDCRYRLADAEINALTKLDWREKSFSASSEIVTDRSRPLHCHVLVEGMAANCLTLASGERQIAAVHVPGDFVDLHGLLLQQMDHSVVALTECKAAMVKHSDLKTLVSAMPHLGRLLFSLIAIDGAMQRNRILSLGRKSARARLADFLCGLYLRYELVGLAQSFTFPMPLTQSTLSDILGLSIVHTNRTVAGLRASSMVEWTDHTVRIIDWDGLVARAEFDAIYLHLEREKTSNVHVRTTVRSRASERFVLS